MKIESLTLKNFKSYKKVTLNCDEKFNIIIGPNNIGKSTIIESILLWKACLNLFIQDKNHKKLHVGYKDRYLSFKELFFIRISNDSDLFLENRKKATIKLSIKIDDEILDLGFNISKPDTIKNSYFKINYSESIAGFNRLTEILEEKNTLLSSFIFIYQTKPVSQIIQEEPFYNDAQILKKISLAKSHQLIRNKIYKTMKRSGLVADRFLILEEKIENVIGHKFSLRWRNRNQNDDEHVKIGVIEEGKKEVEIALMGSGYLQVVEIFSTLQFIEKLDNCINIVLIDEPDAHIHSNLQVNMLHELLKEEGIQSFIITHNDRLIETILEEGNVLYINQQLKEIGTIDPSDKENYSVIKEELANKINQFEIGVDKDFYVISEDENLDLIEKFLILNGYDMANTEVISYYGCDNIGGAIAIGRYVQNLYPHSKIIVHRDKDYLDEAELNKHEEQIIGAGFNFYQTKGVDIESEFINAEHINFLYNTISLEKASELIEKATNETKEKSIDKLLKKKALKKESGYKFIKLYEENVERYRYGKKVFGVLNSLIQHEIGENCDLLKHSEFIESETLKELLLVEAL